ncbi:MAG: GAF domain-containing protein [Bacteroidia bacterium]|nr:GAF domain-containing protein [Bacteroidia bacterium]
MQTIDYIRKIKTQDEEIARQREEINAFNEAYRVLSEELHEKNENFQSLEKKLKTIENNFRRKYSENIALLKALMAILKFPDYKYIIKIIYHSCKKLIGAQAGLVSLLTEDNIQKKVLYSDIGKYSCTVDGDFPMSLRGSMEKSYKLQTPVYENNFPDSEWTEYLPKGHIHLQNVMFVPFMIENKVCGLLGFANKPGEFNDDDKRMTLAFSEFISIALHNNRILQTLKEKVKKIEQLNKQLKNKNEDLEKILYIMTHDLRSPLINIHGFSTEISEIIEDIGNKLANFTNLETLRESLSPLLNSELPLFFNYIFVSINKLDSLISALLKLFRLGRTEMTVQKIDMNNLLADVISNFEYGLKEKNVDVVIGKLPSCKGDLSLIHQVFSNIIDNALKYGSPGKKQKIVISGTKSKNFSVFSIEDNGKGISPNEREKIFELFYRSDNSVSGEGLGLAASKKIIEMHGGKIWVDSVIGEGCKFYISLNN